MTGRRIGQILRALVLAGLTVLAGYIYGKRSDSLPVSAAASENEPVRTYTESGLILEGMNLDVDAMTATVYGGDSEETIAALQLAGMMQDTSAALLVETGKYDENGAKQDLVGRVGCYLPLPREMSQAEGRILLYHMVGKEFVPCGIFFRGSELAWIAEDTGYYLAVRRLPEEKEETVSENEAVTLPEEEPLRYRVITNVNIRSGPGTNTRILGSLNKDDMIEVLDNDEDPDWLHIRYEGDDAYVNAHFAEAE